MQTVPSGDVANFHDTLGVLNIATGIDDVDFEHGLAERNKYLEHKRSIKDAKSFRDSLPKIQKKKTAPVRKYNPVDVRTWLKMDVRGNIATVEADKYNILSKLGLQPLDLHFLDPMKSSKYPSAILHRENAIIVNLEYIRCIITTEYVLVVNPLDEKVASFVNELKQQISAASENSNMMHGANPSFRALSDVGAKLQGHVQINRNLEIHISFELKALEVCLETISTHLDMEATEVELMAYPAVHGLEKQPHVSSLFVEEVRAAKDKLVRLTTRVQTVREVLGRLLDDDADMAKLKLSANRPDSLAGTPGPLNRRSSRVGPRRLETPRMDSSSDSSDEEAEVQEVEMLLEAYDMHLGSTMNRLETMDEYIKDTEDLVNITLAQQRNKLITVTLLLKAAIALSVLHVSLTSAFTVNLTDLTTVYAYQANLFTIFNVTISVASVILYVLFVVWCWWRQLIVF